MCFQFGLRTLSSDQNLEVCNKRDWLRETSRALGRS